MIYTTTSPSSSPSLSHSKSPSSPSNIRLDSPISSPTYHQQNQSTNNTIIPLSINDVYKVSSSLSKYVANGIIEPLFQFDYLNNQQSKAKPITYFETHQSDNQIANYEEEEYEKINSMKEPPVLINCVPLENIKTQQPNEIIDYSQYPEGEQSDESEDS